MTIEYRTGDLFAQGLPAIGHGVNCRGVMGAGIASEFRRRWPEMYAIYRQWCRPACLKIGDVLPYGEDPIVYNLATQDRPGPYARLDAIRQAVKTMLDDAHDRGVTAVGVPRIGAGIGGLKWSEVADVLEQVASGSEVQLIVVTLCGEGDAR